MSSNPPIATCTVITRSYLGDVRALVRTLRRWHPDARPYVLVIDGPGGKFDPALEDFTVLGIADLDLPDARAFCFQYTAFELCNALKVHLLRHVLEVRGEPAALYLDGDLGVYAPLDELWGQVLAHDVLLTPHATRPFPADGHFPHDLGLLAAGAYNAGVLGVRSSGEGPLFLEWWARGVRHDCVDDRSNGLYVDQKYLDLVPGFFPGAAVLRHDGVNVAHFNLHQRRVHGADGRWRVNEVPLLLFHFTQIRHREGTFWPPVSRPFPEQQEALRGLFASYLADLEAVGWAGCRTWDCGLSHFDSGRPISPATRVAFRKGWVAGGTPGDPYASPEWEAFERGLRWREWPRRAVRFIRRLGRRQHP